MTAASDHLFTPEELRFLIGKAVAIRRLGKTLIASAIKIGGHLTEAKATCGHGRFGPWLKAEFGWSERTARNFMQVHELVRSANFADLEGLDISGAYLLAAPSAPPEVREEILAKASAGESVSHKEVKAAIESHRGENPPPEGGAPEADKSESAENSAPEEGALERQRMSEPDDHNLLVGRIVDGPAGWNPSPRGTCDLNAGKGRDHALGKIEPEFARGVAHGQSDARDRVIEERATHPGKSP